jgi:hypothetical protein
MRPKLFYSDVARGEPAWMIVMDDDPAQVVEIGLTVSEAIRRSALINKIKMKNGLSNRATVQFSECPKTILP